MRGIPFADLKVGDQGSLSKTVSEHDIYTYAGLTGDFNPIHVKPPSAARMLPRLMTSPMFEPVLVKT